MKERKTHQKEEILDIITNKKMHVTASDVYALLQKKGSKVSLATVYRQLDRLVKDGILIKNYDESLDSFFYDTNLERHDHLYCIKCHKYYDLEPSKITISSGEGHKIISSNVSHIGICLNCSKKEKRKWN